MPSKQSEAVRRHWEAARLAMVPDGAEGPDNESWGDLTAEPRGVDYLETEAGGRPARWGGAQGSRGGGAADRLPAAARGRRLPGAGGGGGGRVPVAARPGHHGGAHRVRRRLARRLAGGARAAPGARAGPAAAGRGVAALAVR